MDPNLTDYQNQAEEVCRLYTNVTSMLLEYGYQYMLEHLENQSDVGCIENILDSLEQLEKMKEDRSWRDDDDYLLRLSTAESKIFANDRAPLVRFPEKEKESSRDRFRRIATVIEQLQKATDNLTQRYMNLTQTQDYQTMRPPSPENVAVVQDPPTVNIAVARAAPARPKTAKSIEERMMNTKKRITTLRLKRNINNKVQEKLASKVSATQDHPANDSVNAESLHLKI